MRDNCIKCLVVIVDRGKANQVCKILKEQSVGMQYVSLAHGTAHSVFIDYLGLAEPEKEIVLGLAAEGQLRWAISALKQKMHLDYPGKGIAFAVKLTSITQCALEKTTASSEEGTQMEDTALAYELIIAVSEPGLSEAAVEAAREAGAKGGTIMKARSMCPEDVKRVLGYTVQSEKELILMLTPKKDRRAIMQAMCDCISKQTGERPAAFSLPVSDVVGLVGS
ncbi:MAG: hypothetical protein HFG44_01050 [Oscillospiraceae bacterium]|nr:hypothetical protein [Oscillospiraceae bacterium]